MHSPSVRADINRMKQFYVVSLNLEQKLFTTRSQWEVIVIASKLIEAQEMEFIKSRLVFVLQLIGREGGSCFLEQSKDKV